MQSDSRKSYPMSAAVQTVADAIAQSIVANKWAVVQNGATLTIWDNKHAFCSLRCSTIEEAELIALALGRCDV